TSMQFERILSASGPYEGHLKRPGDGKVARRIAWIQCVGSRDVTCGNDYCSSVCCMYATKEAIIAKEHQADVEPTIFFIDLRAFGKGFESFYNRAESDYGVRYVRSQISSVKENPLNGNLIVRYVGEGVAGIREEEFDLVVLSVGLTAHASTKIFAQAAGLDTNRFGFIENQPYLQSLTNREGVFMCGAVSGPRDIPETVMQASAAAAMTGELLGNARGTEVEIKEYPPQRDISGEEPRIGVFICHCGSNIASTVDVEQVAEAIGKIPGVVHAETNLYTCSQDTQEKMKQIIRDERLNRVIVASCTPRTHQPLFQETMREAGLNQWMFEMADIREQCSWVHQKDPTRATQKAIDLVRGSVGKSKFLEPLTFQKVGVTRAALVIGGGISGMAAALSLARQGFATHLVEKSDKLGGNLYHVHHSIEGHDWQAYLQNTIRDVQAHENITVYLNSQIDETAGFVGNFTTRLQGDSTAEIKHGVIIVATGAAEYQPDKFLFGQNDRVVTQWQLEEKLQNGFNAQNVVMIQCVGSRDDEHPWCSRVCCGEAVKNALAIKAKNPAAEVTILYRDIRTYEYKELYYRKAREMGVRFIHFPDDKYPEVTVNQMPARTPAVQSGDGINITVHDTVINETVTLSADMLVLSTATVPDLTTNERLSELLKAPLNSDGYFMEAHVKLRPVDFANEGIYVCGLAHSPKYTEENITQALAAAGRAAVTLSKNFLEVGGVIAVIDEDLCASCLTCVRECVYNAPFINERGKAEIEAAKCQGCGNCTAACPAKAIQLRTFTDAQEHALFMSILKHEDAVEVCS
ncbi:MAG: CoB--CoM heterodisulfide reductase iron-sulfur subunit A family protein, partial [Sedimentisphaerales bacterium]|nr:CoB--CoM heterodisulfide reductase iron-sulfur subunit A family protein [Sedimentisphaerales bacterium]